MSDFEERIRRELTTVAALARPETIRPLRAPAPGRQPRVSGWLAPIVAMVTVAGIAGLTVAGREIARRPASAGGQQTTPGPASAAGQPDIYVTLAEQYLLPISGISSIPSSTGGTVLSATIHNASSGAALTSVQVWPRQPEHPRGPVVSGLAAPAQIAAAADDRTFVISAGSGLYILHVAASGHAAQVVQLGMTIPTIASSAIALSPDASKLAADIEECPPPSHACVEGIEIVTLTTGAARIWLGSSMAGVPLNPAWTDDGKAVMFQWSSGRFPRNGYRILSDAAPQGNLTTESVPLPYPPAQQGFPPTAVLTPDGRSLLIVTTRIVAASRNSGTIIFRITDVAPGTGRLLRVLRVFEEHYQGNPYLANVQCSILSLAPAGLHALVECPQFGRLDGSTFTPLPGGPPDHPNAPAINAAW